MGNLKGKEKQVDFGYPGNVRYIRMLQAFGPLRPNEIVVGAPSETPRDQPSSTTVVRRASGELVRGVPAADTRLMKPATCAFRCVRALPGIREGATLLGFGLEAYSYTKLRPGTIVELWDLNGENVQVPVSCIRDYNRSPGPREFEHIEQYFLTLRPVKGLRAYQVVGFMYLDTEVGPNARFTGVTTTGKVVRDIPTHSDTSVPSSAKYRCAQDFEGIKKGSLLLRFGTGGDLGRITVYTVTGKAVSVPVELLQPW